MEGKVIFDVSAKPFEWQPLIVSFGLFLGGCLAIVGEGFRFGKSAIKRVGYLLVAMAVLAAAWASISWHVSRRERIQALAGGEYETVEGVVESFLPAYSENRKEESFTISGHTFRYSDTNVTICFNQPTAHGGPIRAGLSLRVKFIDDCILQIQTISTRVAHP
jgi:hypothetical protein